MQVATQNMTAPKLRFEEFKLNPIRAKKMSDFGSFYYGKSAPKHSLSDDAPTPCVRYGELYSKFGENISKIHSFTNIDPKNLKFSILEILGILTSITAKSGGILVNPINALSPSI